MGFNSGFKRLIQLVILFVCFWVVGLLVIYFHFLFSSSSSYPQHFKKICKLSRILYCTLCHVSLYIFLEENIQRWSWASCKLPVTYSNIHPTRCNVTQFILPGNCSTCFGWYHHPSSGVQTTVSTVSGICHNVTATCRYRGRVGCGLSVLCKLQPLPTLPR